MRTPTPTASSIGLTASLRRQCVDASLGQDQEFGLQSKGRKGRVIQAHGLTISEEECQ